MEGVFKGLADPKRRQILKRLAQGDATAGELAEGLDTSRAMASHHFAVLKEAGLVRSRRDGQQIFYTLDTAVVQDLMMWLYDLLGIDEVRRPGNETSDG